MAVALRSFDPPDYPHGCRCACCNDEFTEGQIMIDRWVSEDTTTPTCVDCEEIAAPLEAGHPFHGC